MALYEITLEQSYFGQQIINRWNYQSGAIPGGSSGAFLAVVGMGAIEDDDTPAMDIGTVFGYLAGLQVDDVVFVQAIAKNLYSNTDFFTFAFPPGTVGLNNTADGLSPASAWGFTSDRTRADIRRAQKRFVGIGENYAGNGGNLTDGAKTSGQILGDIMGNPNTATFDGVTTVFTPVVLGREKYVVPDSGKDAYRYYSTEAAQLLHLAAINTFTLKPTVRTQASRQYGRGS